MRILVTGGSGYKGSVLVPKLLNEGHEVTSFDSQWFGLNLSVHPKLNVIKGDLRDIDELSLENIDTIIHLANIANDPAVDLNPLLSWEVNVLAGQQLIDKAVRNNVKHFIYASSGSVYGVKEESQVTEDLPLVPLSIYNKTKMVAERICLSYSDSITVHCIRPATVCGLSPRMRLDVAVNMLTYQALSNSKITVLGGSQTRPNIHIDDISNLYIHLLKNSLMIPSGCYNAGFENMSILSIAELIQSKLDCEILIKESNDPRSYRQDSTKIMSTGFKPRKGVSNAIDEIIDAYNKDKLKESIYNYTVNCMKELDIK